MALNTLLKCLSVNPDAVRKHTSVIISCLKDSDSSIKKRALELCFALVDVNTIEKFTLEILSLLEHAEDSLQRMIVRELSTCISRFSPSLKFQVDTVFKILRHKHCTEEIVNNLLNLVARNDSIQMYATRTGYQLLCESLGDGSKRAECPFECLMQATCWMVGEYYTEDLGSVIETLKKCLEYSAATKNYAINAVAKLSSRNSANVSIHEIQHLSGCSIIEVQQRATEYLLLAENRALNTIVLDGMPRPEVVGVSASPVKQTNLLDILEKENFENSGENLENGQNEHLSSIDSISKMEFSKICFSDPKLDIYINHRDTDVCLKFINKADSDITNLLVQIAVPRTATLEMDPVDSFLAANSLFIQRLRITSSKIKVRIKISFDCDGDHFDKVQDYSE